MKLELTADKIRLSFVFSEYECRSSCLNMLVGIKYPED